ncbi:MAG: NAD(P)/FAD-dependent oxidoreductase [Candidatus Freyarchaeota archaeon]|nr:NAD(P)/FAD-dependent oxidoreductase [Candidatus Jordarchaeia archaeon]
MRADVVVVGGGPAGLTCGEHLARAGLKVVVIDRRETPNKGKPCGGMLTQRAMRKFRIDLETAEREIYGVAVAVGDRQFNVDYRERVGINVDRTRLGLHLAERVEEEGGVVVRGKKVTHVSFEQGAACYVDGDFKCEAVVFADGVLSLSRRVSGWRWGRSQLGLCAQYLVEVGENIVNELFGCRNHFYYGGEVAPFGYAWIFPKRSSLVVGVGALLSEVKTPLKRYLDQFVRSHPLVAHKLKDGKVIKFETALVPLSGIIDAVCGERWIVVGDAAGAVSAITGEGMYFAMESGRIGAGAVLESYEEGWRKTGEYSGRLRRDIGSELRWSLWLRNFFLRRRLKGGWGLDLSSKRLQRLISDLLVGRKGCRRVIAEALPLVVLRAAKARLGFLRKR